MVGIREIAKRANVSISTASYAINGSSKVKTETRDRILAIANELNYIPNMAGRTLKKQKTNLIGVYLTNYGGAFYGELVSGIHDFLHQHHYDVIICSSERAHTFIPEKMVDGAIILDSTFSTEKIESYAARGHQMVVLDRELSHQNVCSVLLDNRGGAQKALLALEKKVSKKIYLVTGPPGTYDSNERLAAAKICLKERKLSYEVILGDFSKESGRQAAREILQKDEKEIGIFCLNDEMAIGMYSVFQKSDWKIGKDIHIVGFDNIEVTHYLRPRLTTIDYSKSDWGKVAAETIYFMLNGKQPSNQLVDVKLKGGKSIGSI